MVCAPSGLPLAHHARSSHLLPIHILLSYLPPADLHYRITPRSTAIFHIPQPNAMAPRIVTSVLSSVLSVVPGFPETPSLGTSSPVSVSPAAGTSSTMPCAEPRGAKRKASDDDDCDIHSAAEEVDFIHFPPMNCTDVQIIVEARESRRIPLRGAIQGHRRSRENR